MDLFTALIVIPARFKSSRFEGKPLALIDGVPMIKRTFLQVKKSKVAKDIIVATDDLRIFDFCNSECIPVMMTSGDSLTGTDRVAEVSTLLNYDFYINVQGDEPIIEPNVITEILEAYTKYGDLYSVYSLYKIVKDHKQILSSTIVKVIVNELDELMYASRLPIPFSNTHLKSVYKQQIPVYGFSKHALDIFSKHKKTLNEQYEDIELLRFLDIGCKIKMLESTANSISVDIPSDVGKVEMFLKLTKDKNTHKQ